MNNYLHQDPYPSHWGGPPWYEIWIEKFLNFFPQSWQENFVQFFLWLRDFWMEYSAWILLVLVILAVMKLSYNALRRREKNIQKLWRFVLFFLSKRQMMIPLIYTLAQRDNILTPAQLQELLSIRNTCRTFSLRHNPEERIKHEKKVSRILFEYFSILERKGKIQQNNTLQRIMKDLEFIDEKLVQVQKAYNTEARNWNVTYDIFPLRILGSLFRFHRFQPFVEENK